MMPALKTYTENGITEVYSAYGQCLARYTTDANGKLLYFSACEREASQTILQFEEPEIDFPQEVTVA